MVIRPGATAKRSRQLTIARRHASTLHGAEFVENLLFRNGPCHICRRPCFCLLNDMALARRLLSGKKPVGTFCSREHSEAQRHLKWLESLGLTVWYGMNRCKMHVLVAALHPDVEVPGAGTPREVAFTQCFIDEGFPCNIIGAMFGYRSA